MSQDTDSFESSALRIQGDRVVLGNWSGNLEDLIAKNVELREMLRNARFAEAKALVQQQSSGEQAALVAIDERPEEILSLTATDEHGGPAYKPEVVEKLPTDVIAQILVPRNAKHFKYNLEILKKMSPEVFERAVDETLDPVYFHGNRTKVSWDWLEAVAALGDSSWIASLLSKVDSSLLEDALLDKVDEFDMNAPIGMGDVAVSAFRVFSEAGETLVLPPIHDPEIKDVIQTLHNAAPGLLGKAVRNAWERAGSET